MMQDLVEFRTRGAEAAIVFIHGFSGSAAKTWRDFPKYLVNENRLDGWDVLSLGYPSLAIIYDIFSIWKGDPDLKRVAGTLASAFKLPPFARYKVLAIVAHSMGGLAIQRALLDDSELSKRVGHLFLFGTPSDGLEKARFGQFWKRQIRDMMTDSSFITKLRSDRDGWCEGNVPFEIYAVAGNKDLFVPPETSLEPFPQRQQWVIDGDHLEIVKPSSSDSRSVRIVVDALTRSKTAPSVVDSARLALEKKNFSDVVEQLGNTPKEELGDSGAITLALALDGLGRPAEALKVLEGREMSTTDALGVLAGRLKRRWLVEGRSEDYNRSRSLYKGGLERAEQAEDHGQAYYHAINIAFLDLITIPAASEPSDTVRTMAQRAYVHAEASPQSDWSLATMAEARLIQGDLDAALDFYRTAIGLSKHPRNIASMFLQASKIAEHRYSLGEVDELLAVFADQSESERAD